MANGHGIFTKDGATRAARSPAEATRLAFTGWAPVVEEAVAEDAPETTSGRPRKQATSKAVVESTTDES